MQVIEITSLSGHSPYNISICDITRTYCYVVATSVSSVPLILNIPTELSGSQEVLVIVTDNIGCEEIQYHFCGEPAPSQTPTTTPTPTPTNSVCNCISIDNPLGITLNFGYTQCDGTLFNGEIYSATTLYVCGQYPYGDSGLIINVSSNICVGNVCPGPTPTPTTTPTPTPTLPPIVGYFEDSCDPSNQFTLSNIPISFSPLSGAYYIESSGFIGCATYVVSSSTNNFYTFIAMGSQPSVYHCQKANFIYPCTTLTPTPSITPTITPSVTSTYTPTPTPTYTPTPTTPVKFGLFQAQSCCSKKITKFIMLPSNFLPGTAVVNSYGECLEIINLSKGETWVTDFWDYGTTYIFCEQCVKIQTCDPIVPTPTMTQTPTPTRTPTQTPTQTSTQTPTQTATPTNTITQTATQTPTQTSTQTPTQTTTYTPTPTMTQSPLPVTGLVWATTNNVSAFTQCSTAGWVISSNNLIVRFNVARSYNCPGGTCNLTQKATATATITVGAVNTNLNINWSGMGEAQATDYDKMKFILDGIEVSNGHAPGGGLGCVDGPIVQTIITPPPYPLLANTVHTLLLDFDTVDALYHVDSFYQATLSFS